LYNLVSYVQTARRTGISEGELTNRLKKAKWKTEQIRYVLRKGIGKNPGMFEIFKFKRRE
jgi:DNA-binding Lrp family transcriptional regulator